MNRAEKRRQQKLAVKAARRSPNQRSNAIQQSLSLAMEHHSAGRLAEAEGLYQQILQTDPNQPVALHFLGVIGHQVGKSDVAVDLIGRALAIHPDYAEAHNSFGIVLKEERKLDDAVVSYRKALSINPHYTEVHYNLGNALKEQGKLDDAVASYHKALSVNPDYAEARNNLGLAFQQQGKLDDAVISYQKALSVNPDYAEAHNNLGLAFQELGQLDDAVVSCRKALAIKPDYAEANSNLGVVLKEQGKLDDAVASYHKAITIKPDYADAHNNLGIVLQEMGKQDDAVASYHKALTIKPNYAEAHSNLGIVLKEQGKLDDAIVSYHKALTIKPAYAEAHNNLGVVLQEQGKLDDALASYHEALAVEPNYADAHYNLGVALKEQGKLDDAVASYRKSLAIKPDYAEAHSNLGVVLREQGKLDDALVSYQKALAIKPDYTDAHSNLLFCHNYVEAHPTKEAFDEACRYGEKVAAKARPIDNHSNSAVPERPLRVGFVSGDFREHSVGYFLQGFLSEIDTNKINIYAYATSHTEDDLTTFIKANVFKWRKIIGVSDEHLAMDIGDDGIDILVDLSGHTAKNRLPLFAWKPAPLQVTWLGYGGTTGIEAIDYVLCDRHVLPPSEETHYVEKPWQLPDTWICFTPPDLEVAVGPTPALANGYITFGSFNNLTKISDQTLACWARILEAVPESRLMLKTLQLKDATIQETTFCRFEAHGIDRQRIILKHTTPGRKEHLLTYQEIDIALDPFPYSGGTTSVEALWMGIPILTLKGDRFTAHMGESFLHNMGLQAWIADTPDDYVKKAQAFVRDLTGLSILHKTLRERLLESPICDAARFADNLEDAFRGMWRDWCTRKIT